MIVENNKKVHLNVLTIIVGTKCNLKCRHCMMGDAASCEIDIKHIDTLIDNISALNMLILVGGEISLYTDKIKEIFDRFIQRQIRINYLGFITNGAEYNPKLVELFNDFRYNHTTYPLEAEWQFSPDKFHFNSGFTNEKYKENALQYIDAIGECEYKFNKLENGIHISGRAKNLVKDDVEEYENINLSFITKKNKIEFKNECKNISGHCENGKCVYNCIVQGLYLLPNGDVYLSSLSAYDSLAKKNNRFAIGNIESDNLFDMVHSNNENYGNGTIYSDAIFFRNYESYEWVSLYLLNKYIKFRDYAFISFKRDDVYIYGKAKTDFCATLNNFIPKLQELKQESEEADAYVSYIFQKIEKDFSYICEIAEKEYFVARGNKTSIYNTIKEHYRTSAFIRDNFQKTFGFDYDLFEKLWKYYDEYDFENYRTVAIKLFNMENDLIE